MGYALFHSMIVISLSYCVYSIQSFMNVSLTSDFMYISILISVITNTTYHCPYSNAIFTCVCLHCIIFVFVVYLFVYVLKAGDRGPFHVNVICFATDSNNIFYIHVWKFPLCSVFDQPLLKRIISVTYKMCIMGVSSNVIQANKLHIE